MIKPAGLNVLMSYMMAFGIWIGTYYALVIYPYVLDSDVKLFLTSSAGAATLFVFGDQYARTRTEKQGDQSDVQ